MKKFLSFLIILVTVFLFPCGGFLLILSFRSPNWYIPIYSYEYIWLGIAGLWTYFLIYGFFLLPIIFLFIKYIFKIKNLLPQLKGAPLQFVWWMTFLAIMTSIEVNLSHQFPSIPIIHLSHHLFLWILCIVYLWVLTYYTALFIKWIKIQITNMHIENQKLK